MLQLATCDVRQDARAGPPFRNEGLVFQLLGLLPDEALSPQPFWGQTAYCRAQGMPGTRAGAVPQQ